MLELTCNGRSRCRFDHQGWHRCSGKWTFCVGTERCLDHKLLSYCREKERLRYRWRYKHSADFALWHFMHHCPFNYTDYTVIMIAHVYSAALGLKVIMHWLLCCFFLIILTKMLYINKCHFAGECAACVCPNLFMSSHAHLGVLTQMMSRWQK